MTAEEFFDKNIKDLDGKETKNSIVFFYKDSIVNAMKEFAQLKCAEQRQICADNADADYNVTDYFDRVTGANIEVYVIKSSILDAKEPEI